MMKNKQPFPFGIFTPSGAARLALAALLCGLASGCVFISANPFGGQYAMEESILEPANSWLTTDKILMIDISGVIDMSAGGLFGPSKSVLEELKDELKKAEGDPYIKALILRVNSPGGGVTASDLCYREILEFKKRRSQQDGRPFPVYAVMLDVAASGGYYVSMAADQIWAHPTTVTGSIGVISTIPNIKGLSDKIGVGMEIIKSGPHKDMGSMWHSMQPEDREIFQGLIDSMYGRFVHIVDEGRPKLDEETVRRLADGRVYTADQALKVGLVDNIGYLDDALAALKKQAGLDDARLISYVQGTKWKSNIYSKRSEGDISTPQQINLVNIDAGPLLSPESPRMYYLWLP